LFDVGAGGGGWILSAGAGFIPVVARPKTYRKPARESTRDVHRLKPGGLHTGSDNWNKVWRRFFMENPAAKAEQIIQQLQEMKWEFGLQ